MTAATWLRAPGSGGAADRGRYPINAPASPAYQALVQARRDQLRSHGGAQLTGLLLPAAAGRMLALASQLPRDVWSTC